MDENYLKKELYDLIKSDSSIFEFIQSGALDGIWYWDLENPENEWMSHKFWESLGYDPKEKKHLSSEWRDIIFQDDLKLALANFEKHCADPNYPYDQIVRYKHKNGSTIWMRCRGLAIRDAFGNAKRMLGAHTDMTDLKETEREVLRLRDEYEKVFNGTQDAMFLVKVLGGNEFRYIRNNRAHQIKTGIGLEEIMNKSPYQFLSKERGDIIVRNYQKCVESRKSITYEEVIVLPAGKRMWLTTLTPIMEGETVSYLVGSSTDITKRKELELELENYANFDVLTGLPNRRLFFERLKRITLESERDHQEFALLFIDLDGFKEINDNFGHEAGDQVLITVGNRLLGNVRKSDVVARMGGDEFTMILRNIKDQKCLVQIVEKIHKSLKEIIHIGESECRVDASIGIAIYPEHGKSSETLLRHADSSMYEIKGRGKGGFKFYENDG